MAFVESAVQQRLAAAGFVGGTNDRAGGFGRRRIQEKDFRRVDKFPGGEDEWKAWEFDIKVSARAADSILVEAMEVAEIASKDITAADFSELEDEKWDGLEDKSRQLYDIFCSADFRRGEVGNSRGTWRGWNRCMANACQKLCSKVFGEGAEAIPGSDESRIR